ncbi:hypothetical protein JCM24511_04953 [Saitozyma sp. JCM 24511]|nr:hypothetical protein JCM24511_04953 [Saitozyma sp. JCM 24511]
MTTITGNSGTTQASGTPDRLRVLIVGGGICGLTCGAALREYADVTILESVAALGELGAAVHLAPNAHRIIKGLGGDLLQYGAMPCKAFQEWTAADNRLVIDSKFDPLEQAGCEWNPYSATVTTKDGRIYTADVVIGADGIKSAVRSAVLGDRFFSAPSGHSAYRGLISADKITAHDQLSEMGFLDNRITMVNGKDRRIILYPTRNRTLLNFVCVLPDRELHEISEEKWSAKGDPRALVKGFSSFAPIWQDLLQQIDVCGLWQLRDQDPVQNWVRGRTIILGDAAHSMLPHQGQGASQAIEDGEAIGACFSGITAAHVPEALERVFNIRYSRATYTQEISRLSGMGAMRQKYISKLGSTDAADGPLNPQQFRDFSWNYFGAEDWEKNRSDWVGVATLAA